MKDKEICQNWIKILRDVFFTIYMYTWSRKPRSIRYNKELAKAAFSVFRHQQAYPPSLHKKAGSWKVSNGRLPLPGIDFKFEAVKNVLTQCLVPQRESWKFHPSTQSLIHDIRNFHKLLP